jgi:hypothetical protein
MRAIEALGTLVAPELRKELAGRDVHAAGKTLAGRK